MDGSDTKRYGDQAKETARSPTLRRTRFVCVSDTHNHAVKLPKGDVLIHAGDLTNQGTSSEVRLIASRSWFDRTVGWGPSSPGCVPNRADGSVHS